ncbi:hypothetical protein [Brucella pituitosa]|uniref:Uncharacterized protein n=1 Tax=Brucella pituitosa TaxID=571256 RepID=A0A643F071_9HYPH|nr:hypothetical protein [Brucella pituitosa]KAB0571083.1 hypothetical protein F7Q93_14055 [Brucella pituitosa]
MDIEYWQRWITVIGLIFGFVGVLLLTYEWPYIVADAVKKLANMNEATQVRQSLKIRRNYEKWHPRCSSKYSIVKSYAEGIISGMKRQSASIQRYTDNIAIKYDLARSNVLDESGIVMPDAVKKQCSLVTDFVIDLKETGVPVNQARAGLKWVLWALVLQILGSIPV